MRPAIPPTSSSSDRIVRAGIRSSRWPESGALQSRAGLLRGKRVKKRPYRRPVLAYGHERKVIVLLGKGDEAEIVSPRDRGDRHAPVGAMLRHRCCDRVVRTRLIPIAVRARFTEQPVDQD